MIVIYFIAHSEWILQRSRADMARSLKSDFKIVSICPVSEYEANLKDAYYESINWSIDRTKLLDTKGILKLRKIIKNFNSGDIVHIFTIKSLYLFIFSSLFFKKDFKVIVSITGLGYLFADTILAKILRNITRPLIRVRINSSIDYLIFQNRDNFKKFVDYSNYKNNSQIISGSGLNTTEFNTKDTFNENIKVIFVGRLMREKGIYEYLDIANRFRDKENLTFFIAGKPDFGNKSSISEREFHELQNNKNISYLGEIDVQKELANYDLLLQPSYHEGFSRILIESIYAGVYCLANNIYGMKEIIEKSNFGILINNNDVKEFEIEINNFMKNKNNISFDSARNIIKTNYSLEAISQQFKELYYELTE